MGRNRSLSAGLQVEDQAASAGGQVELVAVLNVATALDDDVGVRFEQADGLRDDPFDQRSIVAELGLPQRGCDRVRRSP
jgi:hypothetical protein